MKCSICKKLSVIMFTCKCEKNVCLKHRMPEDHKCCVVNELFIVEAAVLKDKVIKI